MAAGEEIEQPFGYGRHICFPCILYLLTMTPDRNDLDLDFFCRDVIHADLEDIRRVSCPNSDLGIPGAIDKGSLVGHGVVVDAGLRPQGGFPPTSTLGTSQIYSDPNATLVGGRQQQGTSTQDIVIMSGAAGFPGQ